MDTTVVLIFIPFFIPLLIAVVHLGYFAVKGHPKPKGFGLLFGSFTSFIIYPFLYMSWGTENDCCNDSAAFSPDHVLSAVALIFAYTAAYFYSLLRKRITSPLVEVTANCLLITGIFFNVFVAIQADSLVLAAIGNLPIIIFLINMLIRNYQFLLTEIEMPDSSQFGIAGRTALQVLYSNTFVKFPLLLVLCLPLMTILIGFLLLFGQKPD